MQAAYVMFIGRMVRYPETRRVCRKLTYNALAVEVRRGWPIAYERSAIWQLSLWNMIAGLPEGLVLMPHVS